MKNNKTAYEREQQQNKESITYIVHKTILESSIVTCAKEPSRLNHTKVKYYQNNIISDKQSVNKCLFPI